MPKEDVGYLLEYEGVVNYITNQYNILYITLKITTLVMYS